MNLTLIGFLCHWDTQKHPLGDSKTFYIQNIPFCLFPAPALLQGCNFNHHPDHVLVKTNFDLPIVREHVQKLQPNGALLGFVEFLQSHYPNVEFYTIEHYVMSERYLQN